MQLLQPMEPVLKDEPFDNPEYIYQVKWDGVRILTRQESDGVILWNRKGRMKTHLYPEVCTELERLALPRGTVLDGEMVSFSEHGRPDFRQVLRRDSASQPRLSVEVCYVLFDCLRDPEMRSGGSVYPVPLEARLQLLRRLVQPSPHVNVTDDFPSGTTLFERMKALQMEGIVAKRKGSLYYIAKKHEAWQKVKYWRTIRADVMAIKMRDGRPASLVIAEKLKVIGHVASGLAASDWSAILAHVPGEHRQSQGVATFPVPSGIQLDVRFIEWTQTGQLRSPVVEKIYLP